VNVLGKILKFITYFVAIIYVILIIATWADCSIVLVRLGRECVRYQQGNYFMGVILFSPVGVPAILISLVLLGLKRHLSRR